MNNQMLAQESKNALAVIMISGAVDLEQRMLTDNQWTVSLLERDLNFIKEQCAFYNGQVLESTQIGLTAEFKDVVGAVKCALDTQKTLTRAAATMQPRDVLGHSIGMHFGHVNTTETKVSGVAITIANQLQLDANWGTIHISESIYNQVDSELDLAKNYAANFIGERYLQKIYQVIPKGFTTSIPDININLDIDSIDINQTMHEFNSEYLEPSKLLFDRIVNDLEVNPNIIEIKQLLLYICLNKWESDRLKLEKLNLRGLIQELLELAATPIQLKSLITKITETVEGEYTPIAATINNEISKLYIPNQAEPQDIYDEVIQSLQDESKDITRIKRLLFYLCKYDLGHLDINNLTLRIAIQELQNLYPSLETLRIRMKQALALINQPEYTAIMDVVIDELSAIYPVRSPNFSPSQIVAPTDIQEATASHDFLPVEPLSNIVDQNIPNKDRSEEFIDQQIAELELFDLRLEIIKYLSPLRVKILIFSTLNNVAESTNESILAIRTYELDDMLRDLFYAYKNPEKLETQLKITAKQFKDIDEYQQAATVIMSALMSIYKKLEL